MLSTHMRPLGGVVPLQLLGEQLMCSLGPIRCGEGSTYLAQGLRGRSGPGFQLPSMGLCVSKELYGTRRGRRVHGLV